MKMTKIVSFIGIVAVLAMAVTASAASGRLNLKAKAAPYDPGHTGEVLMAKWVHGAGRVASTTDDLGLILAMNSTVAYPPGASADATITGVGAGSHKLNSLGFDHKIGTACTNGSPRFSVETPAGGSYAFGCASGTHVDMGDGWERITFSDADVQNLGGPIWPGFASAPGINFLQVLQDEAGTTTLDNLNVMIDGGTYIMGNGGKASSHY